MSGQNIIEYFYNYESFIKNKIEKYTSNNPSQKIDYNILINLINKINDKDFNKDYCHLIEYKFLCRYSDLLIMSAKKLCAWEKSDNSKFIDDNFKYFSFEMQKKILNFKMFICSFKTYINKKIIYKINLYDFSYNLRILHELLDIQKDSFEYLIAMISTEELIEFNNYITSNNIDFIIDDISNETNKKRKNNQNNSQRKKNKS